jgi:hypothetical protein
VVGETVHPTLTDPKPRGGGRKRGPDLSVLVDTTIVGLFGLVAVATGHEHWLKERDDVVPMTGPLNAWIDQLPSKTLKKLEKNLAPALFAVGCAIVVGPDIAAEVRLRAIAKKPVLTVSGPQESRQRRFTPPDRYEGAANGAGIDTRGQGGWASSVPTAPPIGFDGDV